MPSLIPSPNARCSPHQRLPPENVSQSSRQTSCVVSGIKSLPSILSVVHHCRPRGANQLQLAFDRGQGAPNLAGDFVIAVPLNLEQGNLTGWLIKRREQVANHFSHGRLEFRRGLSRGDRMESLSLGRV